MKSKLPLLGGTIALTACNSGGVNLIDKITDGQLVSYCENRYKCSSEWYEPIRLFECVDSVRDGRHKAAAFGCSDEYEDLLECEFKEATAASCRSDFEEREDWEEYLYEESDYDDACDDEKEDYNDCENEFLGIESY